MTEYDDFLDDDFAGQGAVTQENAAAESGQTSQIVERTLPSNVQLLSPAEFLPQAQAIISFVRAEQNRAKQAKRQPEFTVAFKTDAKAKSEALFPKLEQYARAAKVGGAAEYSTVKDVLEEFKDVTQFLQSLT